MNYILNTQINVSILYIYFSPDGGHLTSANSNFTTVDINKPLRHSDNITYFHFKSVLVNQLG